MAIVRCSIPIDTTPERLGEWLQRAQQVGRLKPSWPLPGFLDDARLRIHSVAEVGRAGGAVVSEELELPERASPALICRAEAFLAWCGLRAKRDLERLAQFASFGPQTIAIAGASGLVGTALTSFLQAGGQRVSRLVRGRPRGLDEIAWNPAAGELDTGSLEGIDAVVHLGGVSIAKRFTKSHKAAVRESRIVSTRLLSETIRRLDRRPRVFICASAVGFYGDRGDEPVDESSPPGRGFLAEVAQEWEAACEPARVAGVRVVNVRLGMVLAAAGGALAAMLTPFRLGFGGVLGSGRQYMSWIALDDVVGAMQHALFSESVAGPVNAVGPTPVTNREFTRALGSVLRRPTVLPAPAFAIRLLLGEMGRELLLSGCRALPKRLTQAGFQFVCPTLIDALRWELGIQAGGVPSMPPTPS